MTLFHLVAREDWDRATWPYAPNSLTNEGFVHLSTAAQVEQVVAERYADRDDLLTLEVDPSRLRAELRWEDSHGDGRRFPHVYGPIEADAIVAVRPYTPVAGTVPPGHG